MTHRTPCSVPFCGRTIAAEKIAPHTDWVCSKHWALVSRTLKRQYRVARRRARKVLRHRPEYAKYWLLPPGSPGRLSAVDMWARLYGCWKRCKTDAIEKAMEIR